MKKRRLSILLSIVMLFSLLPTTALAADTYPTATAVSVDGNKSFSEGHYYFKNGDHVGNFSGEADNYNAYYNPNTGVLTLQNYNGGSITAGGNKESKITVVLVGDNFINDGNLNSPYGGDITVTSGSSGGTLSITQTIDDSNNAAIGIKAGYGNYETGSVTITGSADVKIEVTHNGKNGQEDAYGIFAKENITISENASVDITCATPKNTESLGSYCNGLRADKNVIIDTTGTININVKNAGKDENNGYSYGVYPMGTATLTKVGNMEVQWKKEGNNTSHSGGAFTGGASFRDTDHAINVDETNCYASYRNGTPRTVTVENGTLAGTGVPNAKDSGKFLAGDKVDITPDSKAGRGGGSIPFKEWTSSDVTLEKSATTASNSFIVPGKDVTVTAKHNPFDGAPTFTSTGTTGTEGTLTFKTLVMADETYEGFRLVKEAEVDDTAKYKYINPSTTSTSSPYEYSYKASIYTLDEGNYYVVAYLNNDYYLGEKVTVSYTAAPAGNYSDSVTLYNANKKLIGLGDGECLTANDATAASSYTGGSSYVARYDKSSGTLYLNGYHGVAADGQIYADGDLNIVVENDSSFTTSVSATNNLYGIQANGKLNISGSGKLTVTANGNGNVYGIYANEGVTISAPLNVQVGKVDSSKNGPVYGIYTQSGAISLSDGDKTITATGGSENAYGVYNAADTSTTITDNGYIDISGNLTVNLSNGSSNVGIRTGSGGAITLDGATVIIPGNFNPGIFNNNGNVIIKNNSNVTLTSDVPGSWGVYAKLGGDLIIENSTVKVSADSLAACLERGNVSIKDSKVELTSKYEHYEVIRTGNSSLKNTINLSGKGSVTLTASGNQTGSMIGGTVSITTPGTKCVKGTYYDYGSSQNYDGEYDGSSKTVLQFVHESTAPTATVDITAGTGMTLTSGTANQTGLTGSMTDVVYTADTDYYFPDTYSVASLNGVDVTRIDFTKIKVSGTPTANTTITLVDATAKAKETTPTASFTATGPDSGTLSGVDSGLKYQINSGAWTDITSSADVALTGLSDCTINVVKKGNGTTTTDSTAQTITVTKAAIPSTVTAVGCTTDSNNNGKLENVTTDMEYQKSGDSAWKPGTGSDITGLTNGTYLVRVKATGTTLASDHRTVTINAFGTTPAAEPNASFTATDRDAGTLVISGTYTATMKYSVDGGSVWNDVTSASMDITGVTAAKGIQVKDVGNGSTTSESSVKNITVTEGTKPTGLTVTQPSTIGGNGKIETTTSHEYNTNGSATFTSCTGALDNLTAGDYYVRVKAAGAMLASETATYTITAFTGTQETQPNAAFTATGPDSGTLSNLVSGGEYAVTGAATANFTASGTTYDLTGVSDGTLSIVKKGNGTTTTDSTAQTITVTKAAIPSTVTAVGCTTDSNNNGKLENVTTDMEYQKSGDSAWKPGTGSDITGLTNGTYLVRVKANGTELASDAQSVTVAVYTGGGSSSGGGGGGYVPTTQKPEIKAAAGGKAELSKDGTTLTITADAGKVIDKVLLNGKDMGAVSELKGLKTGDKVEVIFKDQVTEPTKEELDKAAKEAAGELVLPARSAKLKNGSVKVVVKADLKAITDAGYTVKYKFYRSTKKSAGYKAMKTGKSGIYINTYGKKGTMYYYKARVMIYDKDGNFVAQTALKQCKYANRLWTK